MSVFTSDLIQTTGSAIPIKLGLKCYKSKLKYKKIVKFLHFSFQQCMNAVFNLLLVVVKHLLLNCRKLPSHFICYGSIGGTFLQFCLL